MISICIPFRPAGPERDQNFAWVLARWRALFPDAEIVIGTNRDEPFNRAKARNDAFRRSTQRTVIFADADTTASEGVIAQGLDLVTNTNWVIPYDAYYNVSWESTETILASDPGVELDDEAITWEHRIPYPPHAPYGAPVSGIIMMRRHAFEAIGGFDTQYVGWGYEDTDFALAADTLWEPASRLAGGYVFHLWHPITTGTTFDSPHIATNRERHEQYVVAAGDPIRMRAIKGRSL